MSAERCCLIIDSQPLTRVGIRRVLGDDWVYEELADGRGAVDLLSSVEVDVAIVEMRASVRGVPSGSDTIRRLIDATPGIGVVAHGGRTERHAINEAVEAGAGAYISKRSMPDELRRAVDGMDGPHPYIDPTADRRGTVASSITPRQREILQLFADGYKTEEIAQRL